MHSFPNHAAVKMDMAIVRAIVFFFIVLQGCYGFTNNENKSKIVSEQSSGLLSTVYVTANNGSNGDTCGTQQMPCDVSNMSWLNYVC